MFITVFQALKGGKLDTRSALGQQCPTIKKRKRPFLPFRHWRKESNQPIKGKDKPLYEISKRYVWLAAMAAMFFGSVAFGASGHMMQTSAANNNGHVAILQQSGGDDGHMQIAYGFDEGSGHLHATGRHGQMICTNGINVSTTGGHVATTNDGHQFAPRPAGRFSYFKDTMALMRENWLMETNSGGHGHRLSQARQTRQGHQVMQMAQLKEHYSRA